MAKRKIIKIDTEKCNGCGLCIPNCPEGAIQIIDGKARLISDLFCDGLGACIGQCPQGAITIEEREAEKYDEKKVMANIVKHGPNVIKAHIEHLKGHGETKYLKEALDFLKENKIKVALGDGPSGHQHGFQGCPGSRIIDLREAKKEPAAKKKATSHSKSELRQWPVQIMLVPPNAPYFDKADLLIAADCVPFAYADFHRDILRDKILLVGCPKLDDAEFYKDKITQILKNNDIKSVTCAHMEVPCCFGLINLVKSAVSDSGKDIQVKELVISIRGEQNR